MSTFLSSVSIHKEFNEFTKNLNSSKPDFFNNIFGKTCGSVLGKYDD